MESYLISLIVLATITIHVTIPKITISIPRSAYSNYTNIKTPDKSSNVQVPSPMAEYDSLEALSKGVGFDVLEPKALTAGGYDVRFSSINNKIAQIDYMREPGSDYSVTGDSTYRMKKAESIDEDISGDYTNYSQIEKVTGEIPATLKGENDLFNLAIWTKDGFSHSIYLENGVSEEDFIIIIKSVY